MAAPYHCAQIVPVKVKLIKTITNRNKSHYKPSSQINHLQSLNFSGFLPNDSKSNALSSCATGASELFQLLMWCFLTAAGP